MIRRLVEYPATAALRRRAAVRRLCVSTPPDGAAAAAAAATAAAVAAEERQRKLRALYGGAAAAPSVGKPMGKPVAPSASGTTVPAAGADGKVPTDGEACAVAAEDVWRDSGYIEYMENHRKEGWKT